MALNKLFTSACWLNKLKHISKIDNLSYRNLLSQRTRHFRIYSTPNTKKITIHNVKDNDHYSSVNSLTYEPKFVTDQEEQDKYKESTLSWIYKKLPISVVPYAQLVRLDKPTGTWLLYLPCAWSISMASYHANLPLNQTLSMLGLFGIGAFVMRGAGCTINDMWDSRIDRMVERTRTRPLASDKITQFEALSFLAIQLSAGLAVLTQLNLYSIFLGATSLSLVTIYPFMKRVTYWPQLFLGFAFNWGALLGWPAMLDDSKFIVILPLYASGDKEYDKLVGVKSTALLFGSDTRKWLSLFSGAMVSLVALSGYANAQGLPFYLISVAGSATHLFWIVHKTDFDKAKECGRKFRMSKWTGGIVWLGILMDDMWQRVII
ncbi:1186_t:CDS:2 [Ambispora leptoticha]|uniref:4-hydroxybenzoate polyprenyltransferase, mitochondrial n=1 Tax=Ambispora leptoticha TaxID=144679 RepID=A0A9N9AVQ2_9GLOM|nr:1186_t:CDS:2 [Ambispora leptoticha]